VLPLGVERRRSRPTPKDWNADGPRYPPAGAVLRSDGVHTP